MWFFLKYTSKSAYMFWMIFLLVIKRYISWQSSAVLHLIARTSLFEIKGAVKDNLNKESVLSSMMCKEYLLELSLPLQLYQRGFLHFLLLVQLFEHWSHSQDISSSVCQVDPGVPRLDVAYDLIYLELMQSLIQSKMKSTSKFPWIEITHVSDIFIWHFKKGRNFSR